MSTGVIVNNIVAAALLPPLDLVLVCCAGILLRRRFPRFGSGLSIGALMLLVVFSTRAGALLLVAPLENRTMPLADARAAGAGAIVVLGGGRLANAPEYGGADIPSYLELARLRYAARLQHETGLPVLVSGGVPDGRGEPEAESMARALRGSFDTPVKWLESRSDNTAQNARYSADTLRAAGVRRILLVTDAIHMPRALGIFKATGLEAVAAPTMLFSRDRLSVLDFLPDGEGLRRTHYALHEWLGLLWYRLRYDRAG